MAINFLQVFDQCWFRYWMEVREGNTHTSNNAPYVIDKIFSQLPRAMHRYLRADSGYCNHEIMQSCQQRNIDFVITMRANMYEPLLGRVSRWHVVKRSSFRGRECEIGSCVYHPLGFRKSMRVVFMRAK